MTLSLRLQLLLAALALLAAASRAHDEPPAPLAAQAHSPSLRR